ncbi:tetratricopeptide repeat protein [Duganella sp. sic0402]|uniref:tetratricopeptide repeat protein n=1 Tax=Duganella sp. sic0402 TaxID=2854786 RepID=UPI001C444DB8|nr:tetratricopeptide repeat protein [Duganella sp. sic0402]MBV7537497.1 tetratricopeptide repeat protein [Duganella sp. sic0402]
MKNYLPALLGGLLCTAIACAQEAPVEEDLYLTAMQSIADGRRADASLILDRMLTRGAQHAGEWLDLAMIQCALGNDAEAEALFLRIEREYQPPQGIRDIIAQQRQQGCFRWKPQVMWSVNGARGYDSNVNQGASTPFFTDSNGVPLELLPEYKPHADHYSIASADYLREISPDGDIAFAQAHLRKYDRESGYNSASIFIGAEHPWQAGRWQMRSTALLGALTLGGSLYQEQAQLQLRAAPPLKLPKGYDFALLGSVSRTRYTTLSNFDSTTVELRNILGYRTSSSQLQAAFGYQRDLGSAARPGGDRSGWSMRLYGRRTLFDALQGELELTGQRWSGQNVYSPGLIDVVRKQNNLVLRSVLSYPIQRDQTLQLEWRQVRNRENISIFQYDAHQIQLSWRWNHL